MPTDYSKEFQTPPDVAAYMVSLVPDWCKTILEPTPGIGNIVSALRKRNLHPVAPKDFFQSDHSQHFDCVVMNPPFSAKYAFGLPAELENCGIKVGYHILKTCMKMSNNIIALMPWFTISDSDVRLRQLMRFGLKSTTLLPRKTFQYARIQTCIFEFEKGYTGETSFRVFDLVNDQPKLFV